MKRYLTGKELKEMNACDEARWAFRAIFGKKATIKQVVQRLQNPGKKDTYAYSYKLWLVWLMIETPKLTTALLQEGADVHADDDYALYWATRKGHIEIVKILLEAGANVHARSNYALRWAAEQGYTEIVKILLEQSLKKK